MQKFFYNEKIKITALISELNTAMELYNNRHFDLDKVLIGLLKNCIQLYRDLGYADKESQVQSLMTEMATAQRGINPYTLLKQNIRRNEMQHIVSFKILQTLELLLRTDYNAAEAKLAQAAELVSQIIVAALQAGFLTDAELKAIKTQKDTEAAWKKLDTDSNISLGKKRVLLLVSSFDALLLFDELLATLIKSLEA